MAQEVNARVPCAFPPCRARPEVLALRGISLQYPAQDLIREHTTEPDTWFGLCPASGLPWPVPPRAMESLTAQAGALGRMAAERAAAAEAIKPEHPIDRVARELKRNGTDRWFRDNGGESVATTAEVRAALDEANQQISEGMQFARLAQEKYEQAGTKLNWVCENTVDPLGRPQVSAAREACESAQALSLVAIEANETYAVML